jgi:hypothetical protein
MSEDKYTNIAFCTFTEMTENEFEEHLNISVRHNRKRYEKLFDELKIVAAENKLPVPYRFMKLFEEIRTEETTVGWPWNRKSVSKHIVRPTLYLQFKNTELEKRELELWQAIMIGVLRGMKF